MICKYFPVVYLERGGNLVFMNPRVIPTSIAFWSGWRERMESSTEKTLRWNIIVIGDFLNLGGVSMNVANFNSYVMTM